MKSVKLALALLILVAAVPASLSAQRASFEPVFKGQNLPEPIDQGKFVAVARIGLAHYGWRLVEENPGVLLARYEKSGGAIFAEIRVLYTKTGYAIEYLDSAGLDVDLRRKIIHRNYPRWIANLDKYIYINYLK